MKRIFKLVTAGIICSAVLSTTAQAAGLTCTMEMDRSVTAEITFHEFGFIDKINVKSAETDDVLFSAEDDDMRTISYGVSAEEIKDISLIADMKMRSNLKDEDYKQVSFQALVPKNRDGNLEEITEYISDDGAGFGFLTFKDKNFKLVGASLFLGWAGTYNNCK